MNSQVYLALYTLVTCLGAGVLGFQGAACVRWRSERLNKASAIVAGALALAGIALFALRLGRPERLFGGFANFTSGVTLALYGVVLFVAVCVAMLVMSSRTEDGSVPRWCGIAAIVVSVLLVAAMTCGAVLSAKPGAGLYTLMALYLGAALLFGSAAHLVLGALLKDEAACKTGRATLAVCAVLAGVGLVAYLVWYGLDTQAAAQATKSTYSMSTHMIGGAKQVAATDKLAVVMSGAQALLFWGGSVACGIVAPLVCGVAALVVGKGDVLEKRGVLAVLGLAALACALAGGWCLRLCLATLV